jgi:hypothetical protein
MECPAPKMPMPRIDSWALRRQGKLKEKLRQKLALTASKLPDCMTVSSLSLSLEMRRALSRKSAAEKRYPKVIDPRRKTLAAGSHPGVPVSQLPDCTSHKR